MEPLGIKTLFGYNPRSGGGQKRLKRTAFSRLVLAVLALLWLGVSAPAHAQVSLANRILHESEAEQTAFLMSYLDQGETGGEMFDVFTMLVLNKSSLALPLMERKVEQVLRSDCPSGCFSDKSVDPKTFVNVMVSMIGYAGNEQALRMVSRLMNVDEGQFGSFVGYTLTQASVNRNPFAIAYRGFEIGDPAVNKRIVEWANSEFTSKAAKTEFGGGQLKQWWAEAMVDKYGGAPTERQWAEDPIVAGLSAPLAESIRSEMMRRAVEVLEKRTRK